MAMTNTKAVTFAIGVIFIMNLVGHCYGATGYNNNGLQYGFYYGKCKTPDVESIVRNTVYSMFLRDRTIAPALIRMQFHDCFVNGCDASILLDGPSTEKTAPPNLSVRGYDVIDAAKAAVEKVCPGVVSCADIITMATRDVVFFSGGGNYNVQTGRRDGLVSLAQNTRVLPAPSISVASAIQAFANKGLTATDMIYLLGGHSIGVAHCSLFKDRLYNFQNTRKPDPTMDLGLLIWLRLTCAKNATVDRTANLDQNIFSSSIVDKSFYSQILLHRGVLQIDQELALDDLSKNTVAAIARSYDFNTKFGQAMVKMGAIQVLTGTQGEIRKSCRTINPKLTLTSLIN
ncbi:peroxidase 60-like [Bidens hawaiensis]|uniref:peroxidase 60-like n=1 Tax=Bidens hawaiensis TaxID=980011 RepID=UPI00404A9C34